LKKKSILQINFREFTKQKVLLKFGMR